MSDLPPEEAFPEPNRFVLKTKRVIKNALAGKAGLLCAVAVLFAASYAYTVNWSDVAASLVSGRSSYPVDAALLAEAKKLDLDYDTVSGNLPAHYGKPVLWCLVKENSKLLVNGNMSWMVNMGGGDFNPVSTGRMGACKDTLAVVEKSDMPGVHLAFRGHP